MYCLNLPIEIRFLLENVFIVGIIPGPNKPNIWTIKHIFSTFVETMKQFLPPGIKISTFRHPDGVFVQSRVLPLIADLDAIRPIAGFLSHSANFFCSFCLIDAENIDDFNYESWTYRDGTTVRAQAQKWLKEKTIKAKTALEAKNGVRWASFHEFLYWDPVKHVVLGLMHNTIEGVLGHHLRVLWGIGRQAAKQKVADDLENEERFSESDASDASEDLVELPEDFTSDNDDTMDVDNESSANSSDESERSTTPTPGGLSFADLMFDNNESDDGDFYPLDYAGAGVFNISTAQLDIIRDCIRTVELPSWVGRPPTNLGEASHGKLKAQELLTLFTVIFPLVVPEFWWKTNATGEKLLKNFYDLVASTNIIVSYTTSNDEADRYMLHYVQYFESIIELFPDWPRTPNQHLAMHNGDMLKFWGPLACLSEFFGELMNGRFGRIKTNRRIRMFFSLHLDL